MKHTPHTHLGEIDLCYDKFCTRLTTSEEVVSEVGAVVAGAIILTAFAALVRAFKN